jgi:hypothetical protein
VCDQQRGVLTVYDLPHLTAQYHTASLPSLVDTVPVITGSSSLVTTYAFSTGRIRAVCVDDTANELFVSDELRHCVHVLTVNPTSCQHQATSLGSSDQQSHSKPPILWSRTFGAKGHGRGQLLGPAGLDVSHYHVLVCDRRNHRIAAFTKRGSFVTAFGSKGSQPGEFLNPRDVKLANIRKVSLLLNPWGASTILTLLPRSLSLARTVSRSFCQRQRYFQ